VDYFVSKRHVVSEKLQFLSWHILDTTCTNTLICCWMFSGTRISFQVEFGRLPIWHNIWRRPEK